MCSNNSDVPNQSSPKMSEENIVRYLADQLLLCEDENYTWICETWAFLTRTKSFYLLRKEEQEASINIIPDYKLPDNLLEPIIEHLPQSFDLFIRNTTIKLRAAIMNSREILTWNVRLKPDSVLEMDILQYFLSIISRMCNDAKDDLVVRAFTFTTMLLRLWRNSKPESRVVEVHDDEGLVAEGLVAEASIELPSISDSYDTIENMFIYCVQQMANDRLRPAFITNDVLYDLSMIVRSPVTLRLGRHIVRLCSKVAAVSRGAILNFESCDVKSTPLDLVYSCVYNMLLNTSPECQNEYYANVLAAMSIFEFTYDEEVEFTTPRQRRHIQGNLTAFFLQVKHHVQHTIWFSRIMLAHVEAYGHLMPFVDLFLHLPFELLWFVACDFTMKQTRKEFRIGRQHAVANLLVNLDRAISDEQQRIRLTGQLLYVLLSPLQIYTGASKLDNSSILNHLISTSYVFKRKPTILNINMFDHPVQEGFISVEEFTSLVLEELDPLWRRKDINQVVIDITCQLVVMRKVYPSKLSCIMDVVKDSDACNLLPCVPVLRASMPYLLQTSEECLARSITSVLVSHALSPGSTAREYVRDLYGAIFDGITSNAILERGVAYKVAGFVSDCDRSQALFLLFRQLGLLTDNHIDILVNDCVTHNEPNVWKIMYRAIQCIDNYAVIPRYYGNLIRTFVDTPNICHRFAVSVQHAFFGTLLCIIQNKRRLAKINDTDLAFFTLLHSFLKGAFEDIGCAPRVTRLFIELLAELHHTIPGIHLWCRQNFIQYERTIMEFLCDGQMAQHALRAALFGQVSMFYGDLHARFSFKVSEPLVRRVEHLLCNLRPNNNYVEYSIYELVWTHCLTLYGKICITNRNLSQTFMKTVENALTHGSPKVKAHAIDVLSDLILHHVRCFDEIMPYLIEFLGSHSYLQVSACATLITFLNNNNVRVTLVHYLIMMAKLVDVNPRVREVFSDMFEEKFLMNNSHLIPPRFMFVVLHFNAIYDHPSFKFDARDVASLQHAHAAPNVGNRSAYLLLLKYLTHYNRFNVMGQMTTEVLDAIFDRTIPVNHNTLSLLLDAYMIIYIISTYIQTEDVAEENPLLFYEKTLGKLKQLNRMESYLHMNYDKQIQQVLSTLLKILEDIHTINANLLQDTFHLIMILLQTFEPNVSTLVLDAPTSQFSRSIKGLPMYYAANKDKFENYSPNIFSVN